MNKYILIIIGLVCVIVWRECLHAARRDGLIAYCDSRVEQAIQNTSDDLLIECEQRIDELIDTYTE